MFGPVRNDADSGDVAGMLYKLEFLCYIRHSIDPFSFQIQIYVIHSDKQVSDKIKCLITV